MDAEEIRKSARPKITKIDNVPVWDSPIWIRKLSAMDARVAQVLKVKDVLNRRKVNTVLEAIDRWYCYVLSVCLVDENGLVVFTQAEVEQFDDLPYNFLCIEVARMNDFALDFEAAEAELKKIMDGELTIK